MLDQVILPDILPPREITDEEFLAQAEGEIRGYGRLLVSGIVAIGKKLTEVKDRVGHGNYGQFIRDRLEFSERTAQQFVQSYEFLKSAQCADFGSLQIDASALRLLARPSTPDEVRTEALERARTEAISRADIQKLIADAKARRPPKPRVRPRQRRRPNSRLRERPTKPRLRRLPKRALR